MNSAYVMGAFGIYEAVDFSQFTHRALALVPADPGWSPVNNVRWTSGPILSMGMGRLESPYTDVRLCRAPAATW